MEEGEECLRRRHQDLRRLRCRRRFLLYASAQIGSDSPAQMKADYIYG